MRIRTQNRQDFILDSALKDIKVDNQGNVIGVPFDEGYVYLIGSYKSNERSMEVLDDIQFAIQLECDNVLSHSSIPEYTNGVYEMPMN